MAPAKEYFLLIVIQILAGINAGFAFSFFEERFTAAMVASTGFLLVGLLNLLQTIKAPKTKASALFWVNLVFLFGTVLPLFIGRILDQSNEKLETIIGIDAQIFHRASETIFLLLIVSTLIDGFRALKSRKV